MEILCGNLNAFDYWSIDLHHFTQFQVELTGYPDIIRVT